MKYKIIPDVKSIKYLKETFHFKNKVYLYSSNQKTLNKIGKLIDEKLNIEYEYVLKDNLKSKIIISNSPDTDLENKNTKNLDRPQSYDLSISKNIIYLSGFDETGLFYACLTFEQILSQIEDKLITCLQIFDYPKIENRGLMLDYSRDKIMKLETLDEIIQVMNIGKLNVLQLYIENTYKSEKHPDINQEDNTIDAGFIKDLEKKCKENHIELMANMQSFGHQNYTLQQAKYRELSESELFWTLSPALDETYDFINDLYSEYLPYFSSDWLNVGADETYDLGKGLSKEWAEKEGKGRVYLYHIKQLIRLADKYNKKIMLFGDILINYPDLMDEVPEDVILLDWDYDPKESYESTYKFGESNRKFWVCPGTGAWNSIFPRIDSAKINIHNLIRDGIKNGASGVLLTDWGDHGHYSMVSASFYTYIYTGSLSWEGLSFEEDKFNDSYQRIFSEGDLWLKIINKFCEIYRIPGIWSKNRCQCVISLFDEPLFGRTLIGPEPDDLNGPFDKLPENIPYVMEEKGHHLLRPIFKITDEQINNIENKVNFIEREINKVKRSLMKKEFIYIIKAFRVMIIKLRLGRNIRNHFENDFPDVNNIIDYKLQTEQLIKDYSELMLEFTAIWFKRSKQANLDTNLGHYADIISRLKYLVKWLDEQIEKINKDIEVDRSFDSYKTNDYKSLPTY